MTTNVWLKQVNQMASDLPIHCDADECSKDEGCCSLPLCPSPSMQCHITLPEVLLSLQPVPEGE